MINVHNIIGDIMDFLVVLWKSILSIIILFFLTKVMGRKQISQLSLYDYVVGITIGSVAAEISTNMDANFWGGVLVMVVYTSVSILASLMTEKSILLRRFIIGTPIVVIEKGKILESSLRKTKFDVNELLQEARVSGYYDLSQIEYAVMEANGKMSFLPKSKYMPVTPSDMKLKVDRNGLVANVVIDGNVMKENLKFIGQDEKWLMTRLNNMGYDDIENIILATCDNKEKITVFEKNFDIEENKVLE